MGLASTIERARRQTDDILVAVIPSDLLDWGDADVPQCETPEQRFAWALFLCRLDGVWTEVPADDE